MRKPRMATSPLQNDHGRARARGTSSLESDRDKIQALAKLKDYAIQRSYSLPESLISEIDSLEHAYLRKRRTGSLSFKALADLDTLTQRLVEITYPVNTDNIKSLRDGRTSLVFGFLAGGLSAAVLAGLGIGLIKYCGSTGCGAYNIELMKVFVAILLGIVGAVIYVMLPNGKFNLIVGLDRETVAANVTRVALGGLCGFVLYIFNPSSMTADGGKASFGLLIPFLGGYSITLVVGLLAKAITAVEITLGLDQARVKASLKN